MSMIFLFINSLNMGTIGMSASIWGPSVYLGINNYARLNNNHF